MIDCRKPSKQADQRKESCLQQDCAQWLKKELFNRNLPQVFYHVGNERKTTPQQGARLKLQGVLKGVSDIVLPIRSKHFSGVYCELKTKSGSPSKEQKEFLFEVSKQGYLALIINDFETFTNEFTKYFNDL